jgi:hypothetical protein
MNRIVHRPHTAPRSPWQPPAGALADTRADSPRLSVWDERARKMGFPPSTR